MATMVQAIGTKPATRPRPRRVATPERWQLALARALAENIQVRQLAGSGQWIATSGTDAGAAYALAITNGVAHGCECPAGENNDPVCKHRAAFYHAIGVLDLDPEPVPPAPAAPTPIRRPALCACDGRGYLVRASSLVAGQTYKVTCQACRGTGYAPAVRHAA